MDPAGAETATADADGPLGDARRVLGRVLRGGLVIPGTVVGHTGTRAGRGPLRLAFRRIAVVLYTVVPGGILVPHLLLAVAPQEEAARQEDQGNGLGLSHIFFICFF